MTNSQGHRPAYVAPRCGYSGIFLVCSIQAYSLGGLLVDWD
jgi:hypothetical protein